MVADRFERLRVVVERSALAKHQARVGRVEEVLIEGPSKRDPDMLSGRTPQNKLVHLAPTTGWLRPGTFARARITDCRAALPARRAGRGHRRPPAPHPHPGGGQLSQPIALAIVGPTASGKSALALELARRHPDVELVSVDSMQVYRGMDIGTAKPTAAERAEVRHHLIDLVEPSDEYTVSRYSVDLRAALADIAGRGHRAVLVGGTGLYVRAALGDLEIPPRVSRGARRARARPGHRARCTAASRHSIRWPRPGWSPPTAAGSCGPSRSRSARAGASRRSDRGWAPIPVSTTPWWVCT